MSTPIAYATVILIWSTTPLAIIWSSETVTPVMAAMLRMALAAVVGLGLLRWLKIPLPWHRPAFKSYLAATLGVYGAMFSTYLAASDLPSGLISLIFGLSPIIAGLLAQLWLGEQAFSPLRWMALLLAVSGLGWGAQRRPGGSAVGVERCRPASAGGAAVLYQRRAGQRR